VIFDAKQLNIEWKSGEIVGTTYGLSDNGWVDSEAGFRSIFLLVLLVYNPFSYFLMGMALTISLS